MTKFEMILRLAEIKGVLLGGSASDAIQDIEFLIEILSAEFQEEHSVCDHIYARKVCIWCGHHHE